MRTGPALGDDHISWLTDNVMDAKTPRRDFQNCWPAECPDFRTEFASVRRRKRYWTESGSPSRCHLAELVPW